MSIADIEMLFKFVGGLGMFLYGMHVMADGLQKSAGGRMKQLLGILTNHRILGVLVGALVTAVIQSSSATTVMVVGFVNAGIISLTQAVGVIMGANIGTTITAWLVSMSEWGQMLKPEFFAPLLIGVGAFIVLFVNKEKYRQVGEILVGFGVLFIGLSFMSSSITPYKDAPIFATAFRVLGKNPILGILTGAIVTAIIQSSSASVGILQTLALNGVVSWNSAIYITLGQNIGTCVTALISSAGANRTAKRAAVIHLLFNVIGAVVFGILMFAIFTMNPVFAGGQVTSVGISIFHTVFNISNTLLLFPFAKQLVTFSGRIIREKPERLAAAEISMTSVDEEVLERPHLDLRILSSPSFAIQSAAEQVVHMGELAREHVEISMGSVFDVSEEKIRRSDALEKTLDVFEKDLTEYLVHLSHESLTEQQIQTVSHLLFTVSDLERIGDHCDNIAELASCLVQGHIQLSGDAVEDLKDIKDVVLKTVDLAISSRNRESIMDAKRVYMLEDDVDSMEEDMRHNHMERLSKGLCSADTGIVFLDILSNLERISDHAVNIAEYVEAEKVTV
ncbi:Na/Pi cotransporter family protein [Frisingicoccus caecimuris]|uniref:Phosphate:Na+ symporter n=1 Tax=Frisingicoccus caecimuris TaxID=1796636 RepID=A0A4R2LJP2_9FIRM|nr:Na/Pi cotransporter family protein [Frisingicoccus caecimuris]MCR1917805.1 Na/Pi cotransporter family protein [Frisingicoccus caecimuris]TCO86645.1 phosphate:Na+ symporter [Frisingicoccus caecimuris]